MDGEAITAVEGRQLAAWKSAAFLQVLMTKQEWVRVFKLARNAKFLAILDQEAQRPSSVHPAMTPLDAIDLALAAAAEREHVAETASLVITRARWAAKASAITPLAALHASTGEDDKEWARSLARSTEAGHSTMWQLVLAWEMFDDGDVGTASQWLRDLLGDRPARLIGAYGHRAVLLLAQAFSIDEDIAENLVEALLDDEDRIALAQKLRASARPAHALTVARSVESTKDRIAELAAIALAVETGIVGKAAREALCEATAHLGNTPLSDKDTVIGLARVAAASSRGHDDAEIISFEAAVAAARSLVARDDRDDALQTIACMQLDLGMIELAERTAHAMTKQGGSNHCHEHWETLEAIARAYARAGQPAEALRTVQTIEPAYADYTRAVLRVGQLVGTRYCRELGELAARASLWERKELLEDLDRIPPIPPAPTTVPHSGWCWLPSGIRMVIDNFASIRATSVASMSRETYTWLLEQDIERHSYRLADAFRLLTRQRDGNAGDQRNFYALLGELGSVREEQPGIAHESAALWSRGETLAAAGHASEAREHFAAALRHDQFGHSAGSSDPRSSNELDFDRLRVLALARIAAAHSVDEGEAAQRSLRLAEGVQSQLPPAERARTASALAAAELQMGLVAEASRRCRKLADSASRDVLEVGRDCIIQILQTPRPSRQTARILKRMLDWLTRSCAQRDSIDILLSIAPALVGVGRAQDALRLLTQLKNPPRDPFRTIAAEVIGRIARHDSLAAARAALTLIDDSILKIDALGRIAEEAARTHENVVAAEVLDEAELEIRELAPEQRPISQIALATSAQRCGFSDTALRMTADAAALIHQQPIHEELGACTVAACRLYVLLGRTADAVALASSIDHSWFSGWARFSTAMQCGALGQADASHQIIADLTHPWWRAAGLTVSALALIQSGGTWRPDWNEAQRLLRTMTAGDSQTRLLELMVSAAITARQYSLAHDCLNQMSGEREFRLLRLATRLADCADSVGALQLAKQFTMPTTAALFFCTVLAHVSPDSASAIERAIAIRDDQG